jgi:hypothetical protein
MRHTGATSLPTLGVTTTLALLWLLAATLGGPGAPAALALDPGRTGSIGAWWGGLQLAAASAVALSTPATRPLAIAPAALLAGEVGEMHIHAARLLAEATGDATLLLPLKHISALFLPGIAPAAVWRARHELCSSGTMVLMLVARAASIMSVVLRCWPGRMRGSKQWRNGASCLPVRSLLACSCASVRRPDSGQSRVLLGANRLIQSRLHSHMTGPS